MDHTILDAAVYEKYIAPTRRARTGNVGVELEFPILNLTGGPVDFAPVHRMAEALADRFDLS